MRSPPVFLLAVIFALLVAALGVGGGAARSPAAIPGGTPGHTSVSPPQASTLQENETLADKQVTIDIQLRRNGDARYTVSVSIPLESDRDRAAFRRLARDFEAGNGSLDLGLDAFRQVGARVNRSTAREMHVTDAARNTSIENDTGILKLSFTWTNFARTEGEEYRVGDAFNTTDGTWLPGLTSDQRLVIRPPRGYAIHSAPAGFTNSTLRIDGPARFERGYLQVTYQRSGALTTTSPGRNGLGLAFPGLIAAGGVLAVVALAAYAVSRREPENGDGSEVAASDADGAAMAPTAQNGEDSPPDEVATGTGPSESADTEDDLELLSDEERVEHLLRENGGRMKQANIVSETGWSNAKVSQLLSSMADTDRVKKLRIGRENLIALPDEDIGEFEP